jgi:hypothetical protein
MAWKGLLLLVAAYLVGAKYPILAQKIGLVG